MTPFIAALMLVAAPVPKDGASGHDWPQWRGIERDGKSAEQGLKFTSTLPKLLWQKDTVGTGYGQPAVVGNRVYLIGAAGNATDSQETLRCLNLGTGEEIWSLELGTTPGKFNVAWGGGPRSTPTVTEEFIYALGATGDLVCATLDGKRVWSKNLVEDFQGKIPMWGYSESPLVNDGRVIVTPGNGTGMAALDAKTGETVWACTEFKDPAGYSSVMPMMLGDTKLLIQQTMESAVGLHAGDGKLAFRNTELGRRTAVIPTPIISGEYVFFTAGYGAGCECYKLSKNGSEIKAERMYGGDRVLANHHGGVIGIGDHVFGHSDSGGWTFLDYKKNKPSALWTSTRLGKGSVAFAEGHFICYQESNGQVAIIKSSTEGWEEVCRFKIPRTSSQRPNMGKVWPHPVIANGKLLLRDFELLFVYDLK